MVKYYRKGTQLYVTFLDNNGNPVANQKVTFNLNGNLQTVLSDANGIATYNFNLNAGSYIITAEYNNLYHSNKITVVN